MKSNLISALILLLSLLSATASKGILVSWETTNNAPDVGVTNYNVYFHTDTNDPPFVVFGATELMPRPERMAIAAIWSDKEYTNTTWQVFTMPMAEADFTNWIYCRVTACNFWGESDPSEWAMVAPSPDPPKGLKLKQVYNGGKDTEIGFTNLPGLFSLDWTDDVAGNWRTLITVSIDETNNLPHLLTWTLYSEADRPRQFWRMTDLTIR